jgi:hypothetical protein
MNVTTVVAASPAERSTKAITGLDDIAFIDTPVKCFRWESDRHVERLEHESRAILFKSDPESRASRLATVVNSNVYGEPLVTHGRLECAIVQPRPAGGWSPWSLNIGIVPSETKPYLLRDFPVDPMLFM